MSYEQYLRRLASRYPQVYSRARQPRVADRYSDEEAASTMKDIASMSLAPVAVLGGVLDIPRSMISDTVMALSTGKWGKYNPFDQIAPWNWADPSKRTESRDVLRQFGLIGKKNTWGNFGAGLALDILTDPLTYMTFGASAANKVGKLLSKSGAYRHVGEIARLKGLGRSSARLTATVDDFLKHSLPAERKALGELLLKETGDEALDAALAGVRRKAADAATEEATEQLGEEALEILSKARGTENPFALARFGLPDIKMFGRPSGTLLGTAAGGELEGITKGAAKVLDAFSWAAKDSYPARVLRAAVYRPVMGALSESVQRIAPNLFHGREYSRQKWVRRVNDVATQWQKKPVQSALAKLARALFGSDSSEAQGFAARALLEIKDDSVVEPIIRGSLFDSEGKIAASVSELTESNTSVYKALSDAAKELEADEADALYNAVFLTRDLNKEMIQLERSTGQKIAPLDDRFISHFTRSMDAAALQDSKARAVYKLVTGEDLGYDYTGFDVSAIGRSQALKNVRGGTATLYKLFSDSEIRQAVANGAPSGYIAGLIRKKFGDPKSPWYIPPFLEVPASEREMFKAGRIPLAEIPEHQFVDGDRYKMLADLMRAAGEEQIAKGFFTSDPLEDLYNRAVRVSDAINKNEFTAEVLAFHAKKADEVAGPSVSVRQLAEDLDMDQASLARQILHRKDPAKYDASFARMTPETYEKAVPPTWFDPDIQDAVYRAQQEAASFEAKGLIDEAQKAREQALEYVRDKFRRIAPQQDELEAIEDVLDMAVPADIAKDLKNIAVGYSGPQASTAVAKFLDALQSVWKGLATVVDPKFHGRNLISGAVHNMLMLGLHPVRYASTLRDAFQIMSGKEVKSNLVARFPSVVKRIIGRGETPTNTAVSEELRRIMLEADMMGSTGVHELPEFLQDAIGVGLHRMLNKHKGWSLKTSAKDFLIGVSELVPGVNWIGSLLRKDAPRGPTYIPLDIVKGARYVAEKSRILRSKGGKTRFFGDVLTAPNLVRGPGSRLEDPSRMLRIWKWGAETSGMTEKAVRLSGIMSLLDQGMPVERAARVANDLQLRYDSRFFTPIERTFLKRMIPFYSFQKQMLGQTVMHLARHPGGLYARIPRLADKQRPEKPLPRHLASGVSIPWGLPIGQPPEGTDRYITGLGLMPEDAFSLLGSVASLKPGDVAADVVSRLGPLPKALVEGATGRSTYFRGPFGGRELSKLDPPLKRLALNAIETAGQLTGEDLLEDLVGPEQAFAYRNRPLRSGPIEQFASYYPGRLLFSARKLLDPRKGLGVKALNTLTGLRISDVSPGAKEVAMNEALAKNMLDAQYGKTFTSVSIPKDLMERLPEDERRRAELLMTIRAKLIDNAKRRAQGLPERYRL